MLSALREATGNATMFAVAASIDAQRASQYRDITRQIADCEYTADDIERRIRDFNVEVERVRTTWNELTSQKKFSSTSQAADNFRTAANEFRSHLQELGSIPGHPAQGRFEGPAP